MPSNDFDFRLAVDFLYHFIKDYGEIENWGYKGASALTPENPLAEIQLAERLDEQLKLALIKLAKNTLQTEISFYLDGIIPSYDTESMTPSWRITHLLSGLYFTLFNFRGNEDEYRKCAKTNCGKYFLVQGKSSKKIYCSNACSNAAQQSTLRKKRQTLNTKDL